MGNASAICHLHLTDKQYSMLLSKPTKTPGKIDSSSLKTIFLKCFLSCVNKVDRILFYGNYHRAKPPFPIKTLKPFANSTLCFLLENIDRGLLIKTI